MLNIGDFARFAGVSVRMLRHYDSLGLLVPSEVDEFSGYRRYDESLLLRAHQLVAFKELGFTLEEIGSLLDQQLGVDGLRRLLESRRAALAQQIEADRTRLSEVERRLRLIEGGDEMSDLVFEQKELPALTVLAKTAVVKDMSEIGPTVGPMFEGLATDLAQAGDPPAHPGVAWYEEAGDGMRIFAGYLNKKAPVGDAEFCELGGAPRAITAVYVGAMSGIGAAWEQVAAHAQSLGLRFAGPARELYLDVQGPQESWVTELQLPVT
ncbi:MAG: MerR family transcriptional regulator [Marmoricola sp.]